MDERRIEDLRGICREIQLIVFEDDPARLKRPLPVTLEEAAELARHRKLSLHDPDTGEPYGYEVVSDTTYRLAATFALPRDLDYEVFWNHPAGRHAFTIDALDPP